ncbi:MAG: lipase [Micrococcaceae bacterium]|nr:lipase [Micrococcaceae bacterium]
MDGHVVLLGDSIFDNGVYVNGGPDVAAQLQDELPRSWRTTLLARDGDVISGVKQQLDALPADATHLVVSVGGNDALGFAHLLQSPVPTAAEAFALFNGAQEQFRAGYEAMTEFVVTAGLPSAFCTIYDTPSSAPAYPVIRTALTVFNDCITRAAFSRSLPLVDLRLICSEDGDYANPIEPSVQGGRKIASAIAAWALDRTRGSIVIAGNSN